MVAILIWLIEFDSTILNYNNINNNAIRSNKGTDMQKLKYVKMANSNCQFSVTSNDFDCTDNSDDADCTAYNLRPRHAVDVVVECESKFVNVDNMGVRWWWWRWWW